MTYIEFSGNIKNEQIVGKISTFEVKLVKRNRPGMDPAMALLRAAAPANELDYDFIMSFLKDYEFPRSKLSQLTRSGALIRVKRGFYVFGPLFKNGAYCLEALANVLYGPSYVSAEWALQYYGMIPERVEQVTSVTFKKKKLFQTPIGRFSYDHRPFASYPSGVTHIEFSNYQSALIATPEKALVDLLILRRGKVASQAELKMILFEDFRFDSEDIFQLNLQRIEEINRNFSHTTIHNLIKIIKGELSNE